MELLVKKYPSNVIKGVKAENGGLLKSEPVVSSQKAVGVGGSASRQNFARGLVEISTRLQTDIRIKVAISGLAEGERAIEDLANDVFQDTAEIALRDAEHYDPSKSLHAWLMAIAVNKLREQRRESHNQAKRFFETDTPMGAEVHSIVANSLQAGDEVALTGEDRLDQALYSSSFRTKLEDRELYWSEQLSVVNESDRQVLWMYYLEDLNGPDLAAALGISEGAALMRLARARMRLQENHRAIRQIRKDPKNDPAQ
ncbi:MAG: sigma-70 family RNA polymerase sigma factor [Anaerolineaceae bacterium]|nr:sigma-70 family RNA polymerase sigma factor [Anaerolineaceae bacterium]